MSSLDEAFTNPLMNMTGTHKTITGDPSQDYPQIIADMIMIIFHHENHDNLRERYSLKLNRNDLNSFVKVAFSSGQKQILMSFWRRLKSILEEKGLEIEPSRESVLTYLEGPVFYFVVSDDYQKQLIGFGPYPYPVWRYEDEIKN